MDSKNFASAISNFLNSPAGEELKLMFSLKRESIIAKGKKARNEDKQIAVWAELDGFDKCCGMIYSAADYHEQENIQEEE